MKIVKNTTGAIISISDTGVSVSANSQYNIPPQDYDLWAASNDVIDQIASGNIVINDGAIDLDKSDGVRLLQGGYTNTVQLDEDLLATDRIKVDVIGTLGDGQVKVSSNDSTTGFLQDKIISGDNKITVSTINDGSDEDVEIQFNPGNVGTSELNNDAAFINASQAPVQTSDIADFETTTELNARDTNNRNRSNHTGTQLASTISDLSSAIASGETTTTLSFNNTTKVLSYVNEDGATTNVDLTQFLDDTNLSKIVSGTLNSGTGIATFTRDDSSTFDVDFSSLNDQAYANAILNIHEASFSTHDDVDASSGVTGDILRYNGSVWQNSKYLFRDSASSSLVRGTQSTTYQQYLRLTTNIPEAGNYKISWNYEWSLNSTGTDFKARIQINDSNTILTHVEEPQDSGGTGVTVTGIDGGTFNSGTDQRRGEAGFDVVNLTAGSNTIDLDLANSAFGTEAAIYRACITVERFD